MLTALIACGGRWTGANVVQDPFTGAPDSTASMATVTPIVDGRIATAYWVDSWHMGHQVLTCVDAASRVPC